MVPAHDLMPAAYDLACSHGITIYDALFVAATVQCGTCLVTGDGKAPRRGEKDGDHATGPLIRDRVVRPGEKTTK